MVIAAKNEHIQLQLHLGQYMMEVKDCQSCVSGTLQSLMMEKYC